MVVQLSLKEVQDLKRQGFSEQEITQAIQEIENDEMRNASNSSTNSSTRPQQASTFAGSKNDDIARFQLELNDLLAQTEHILKGDVVRYDEKNKKYWDDNPHPENNPLNQEGIRRIMTELQNYVNRHIILGDYDEEDIRVIMKDYGKKFANLLFMKYEEMGMDTDEKRQEYVNICINVVNLVYGSYARAKDGGERRSLREMYQVHQSHQSQGMGYPMQPNQTPKVRGILNPMRYISGKYAM